MSTTKTTKTTAKTPETKEFKMGQAFALWNKTSKDGKTKYLTGKTKDGKWLTAFYNTKKKNPNEPDLRVYVQNDNNEPLEEYVSLWCKVSAKGNKYLNGKLGDKWITGFIRKSDNVKAPYVSVYYQDEENTNPAQTQFTDVTDADELPFD